MKLRTTFLTVFVVAGLLLSACGAQNNQSAIETGIAQTLQISQLETLAAGAGGVPQATTDGGQPAAPSNTPFPSDTPTITMTFTPSVPFVNVSQDTNCRRGPSISYGLVTTILVGQQVQVLKTFSNNYAVVQNPNGSGDCWLYLQYANTTDFSAYGLVAATQPPTPTATFTPTPSFNWNGTWNTAIPGDSGSITLNVSGNHISGTFTFGLGGTISGTVSADGRTATGDYDTSNDGTVDGSFAWAIKPGNVNQWTGNYNAGAGEWCGWRSGSSKPSPCAGP